MFLKWMILCFMLFLSSFSWADLFTTTYSQGFFYCRNFDGVKARHRDNPGSILRKRNYAMCLILKGEDDKGLNILNNLVQDHNDSLAAHIIAIHTRSGGKMNWSVNKDRIDEALQAHFKALSLIDLDPNYPSDQLYRFEHSIAKPLIRQVERGVVVESAYLYMHRFLSGARGLYREHLLASPNYKGDRNLKTYPQYSPYTLDSLEKVIEFTDQCLSPLPEKPFFSKYLYIKDKKICQIRKDTAIALLPMEEQRLNLLANESCASSLPHCPEYEELAGDMLSLIEQASSEIRDILDPPFTWRIGLGYSWLFFFL